MTFVIALNLEILNQVEEGINSRMKENHDMLWKNIETETRIKYFEYSLWRQLLAV